MLDDGTYVWPIAQDIPYLCSSDADCAMHAPPGMTVAKCGNVFTEYDRDPRIFDNTTDMELIFYDIVNFNNIASSGLTVF